MFLGEFNNCQDKEYTTMSINAISSVSIYEYYYKINKDEEKNKSPIEREMEEYGLTPTDSEALNIAMLKKAKEIDTDNSQTQVQQSPSERPWADLMYQLGIAFNDNPKDDIEDIKEELDKLILGIKDDELTKEVDDLKKYVENLYLNFEKHNSGNVDMSLMLGIQLENMSMLNRANML